MGNQNNNGSSSGSGGSTRSNTSQGTGQKKKCMNCGKERFHEKEDCLELPANEGRRKIGWKSVFD
jgi:hypothetical protein